MWHFANKLLKNKNGFEFVTTMGFKNENLNYVPNKIGNVGVTKHAFRILYYT